MFSSIKEVMRAAKDQMYTEVQIKVRYDGGGGGKIDRDTLLRRVGILYCVSRIVRRRCVKRQIISRGVRRLRKWQAWPRTRSSTRSTRSSS